MNAGFLARTAATALLALLVADGAMAQAYPSKPVRIIVPYPAGGINDGLARMLATGMKDELGHRGDASLFGRTARRLHHLHDGAGQSVFQSLSFFVLAL